VAPLLEEAKRSKSLIFNEYWGFLFSPITQKTANSGSFRIFEELV
jgi:hypothetical protein